MKIYLDTNILMDVFVGPIRENYPYSTRLLNAIEKTTGLIGVFSVQSLTDIAYTQSKYGVEKRNQFYDKAKYLLITLKLVTIHPKNADEAVWTEPADFEDLEQILCAEDNDCSWFVSGDLKLLKKYQNLPGRIPIISPKVFLEKASQKGE